MKRPFRRFCLCDNLAGANRVDAPGYIQQPAEGIEVPSGALRVFSDRFIVAVHIGVQLVEGGIFQFFSDILSI